MTSKKHDKDTGTELYRRYIWLAETINRFGPVTRKDINILWKESPVNAAGTEISQRTFHHYINAIEEMFGIDIECNKENRYYISDSGDTEEDNLKKWMIDILAVNDIMSKSRSLSSRIMLEKIPPGHKYLPPIIQAIKSGYTIEIVYRSYRDNEDFTIYIDPYAARFFNKRWYLIGFSHLKQDISIYFIDQIVSLRAITYKTFDFPEGFSVGNYFKDCFGVYTDNSKAAETVLVKASGRLSEHMRSFPMHPSQNEIETRDGCSIFSLFLKPDTDFKHEVLSKGASLEILSPEWLREEIAEDILEMADLYKKKDA